MTDHQVNIIQARSVINIKTDGRLELAAPRMPGDSYILFKNVYRSTGGKETGNKNRKSQNMKQAVPFQGEMFLQI